MGATNSETALEIHFAASFDPARNKPLSQHSSMNLGKNEQSWSMLPWKMKENGRVAGLVC